MKNRKKRRRTNSSINKLQWPRKRKRVKLYEYQYEPLEPRRVLDASPIAINDLDYYTEINTALTISDPVDGVLANDFDQMTLVTIVEPEQNSARTHFTSWLVKWPIQTWRNG